MLSFQFLMSLAVIVFFAPALETAIVRPQHGRYLSGIRWVLNILCSMIAYGGSLLITGSVPVASLVAITFMAVTAVASNIKFCVLGEPLLFSDAVVARSFLLHPKFYLFSIPMTGRISLLTIAVAAPILLRYCFATILLPHLMGAGILLLGGLLLWLCPSQKLAPVPDIEHDIARLGLPGSIIMYWRQWKVSPDLSPPCSLSGQAAYDLIMIVQCESFADPALLDLPADIILPSMPGLKRARDVAFQWGSLSVSGFGAYTMRSEYGVIFGQEETELGFRRYDPFLTAEREREHAIANRLKTLGYESTFVHPHDLRFYNREALMPSMGFSRLLTPGPHIPTPDMPYFSDVALGHTLVDMMVSADKPSLFYTVTMENHGPWPDGENKQVPLWHYLRHVQNSDQMLLNLIEEMSVGTEKVLLVFFGDHRPSIPGIVTPSSIRDVPYVVVSFPLEAGAAPFSSINLTPAQLNHLIVELSKRHVSEA